MGLAEIGQFLIGVAAIGGTVLGFLTLFYTLRINKGVTTLNSQSLAQYADAGESARVHAKEKGGETLTADEQEHIDTIDDTGRRKHT